MTMEYFTLNYCVERWLFIFSQQKKMSEFFGYFRDTSAASRKTMKLFCFHKDYRRVFVAKVVSPLTLGVH